MRSDSYLVFLAGLLFMMSCKSKPAGNGEETLIPKAAVSVTYARNGNIEESVFLNGKTVFLKKNLVNAPISGYIAAVYVQFGDRVEKGKVLFEIQTRENMALEQSGTSRIESGAMGKVNVIATTSGIVNEPISLGTGAYVTEGNLMCSVADFRDLLVMVQVPVEYHNLIESGGRCTLQLPDHSSAQGTVYRIQPFVEQNSQTQQVLVKPSANPGWPENMNLLVTFLKNQHPDALLLPKKALLTNETQDQFWVMKIIQDSIAVKIPVETGIKNDSLVEIVSSGLSTDDLIILEGGYGLEDSSLVNIIRKP